MNRETKRFLRRKGQLGPDGSPVAPDRPQRAAPPGRDAAAREGGGRRGVGGAVDFVKEVRGELRRVAWPSRGEVATYSTVVFGTLVVLITLIFALDFVVSKSVLWLFNV